MNLGNIFCVTFSSPIVAKIIRLFWELNTLRHIKCTIQYLTHKKDSVSSFWDFALYIIFHFLHFRHLFIFETLNTVTNWKVRKFLCTVGYYSFTVIKNLFQKFFQMYFLKIMTKTMLKYGSKGIELSAGSVCPWAMYHIVDTEKSYFSLPAVFGWVSRSASCEEENKIHTLFVSSCVYFIWNYKQTKSGVQAERGLAFREFYFIAL